LASDILWEWRRASTKKSDDSFSPSRSLEIFMTIGWLLDITDHWASNSQIPLHFSSVTQRTFTMKMEAVCFSEKCFMLCNIFLVRNCRVIYCNRRKYNTKPMTLTGCLKNLTSLLQEIFGLHVQHILRHTATVTQLVKKFSPIYEI
jgi:hypothetical protein